MTDNPGQENHQGSLPEQNRHEAFILKIKARNDIIKKLLAEIELQHLPSDELNINNSLKHNNSMIVEFDSKTARITELDTTL